ncbi:hypothetical protein FACS189472_14310 [Alphaproteobacteria bacterium]|nr:hypothetical protein FACS189472_14310 [Alphaproteobacteria bacterium]
MPAPEQFLDSSSSTPNGLSVFRSAEGVSLVVSSKRSFSETMSTKVGVLVCRDGSGTNGRLFSNPTSATRRISLSGFDEG